MHLSNLGEPRRSQFDITGYVPFWLTAIANKWTASTSRQFRSEFDIGITEWRVLLALDNLQVARALDVCNLTGTDTSAVSKAVQSLLARGYIEQVAGSFVGRNRPLALTKAGGDLLTRASGIALGFEERLLAGLDLEERLQLLIILQKIHEHPTSFEAA